MIDGGEDLGALPHYLRDTGDLIKRLALDAKVTARDNPSASDAAFNLGRLYALHEVVSLMQQQARAFNLPLRTISLDDIDPEIDLL